MSGASSFEPFAQAWAAQGFVVIPLARLKNIPHPMLGSGWSFDEIGSTDPEWVRRCWGPDGDGAANVGIVTGARSGVLVLDLDRRASINGMTSLLAWMDAVGEDLPEAPMVRTPSGGFPGGFHLLYGLGQDAPRYRKIGWLPCVDVLGGGGQVPVWPSLRWVPSRATPKEPKADGLLVEYEFVQGSLETLRADMPPAPGWLLDDIMRRPPTVTTGDGTVLRDDGTLPLTETLVGTGLPVGHRRVWAFRLACRLWRVHGDDQAAVHRTMAQVFDRTEMDDGIRREAWRQVDYARRKVAALRADDEAYIVRSYRP